MSFLNQIQNLTLELGSQSDGASIVSTAHTYAPVNWGADTLKSIHHSHIYSRIYDKYLPLVEENPITKEHKNYRELNPKRLYTYGDQTPRSNDPLTSELDPPLGHDAQWGLTCQA